MLQSAEIGRRAGLLGPAEGETLSGLSSIVDRRDRTALPRNR